MLKRTILCAAALALSMNAALANAGTNHPSSNQITPQGMAAGRFMPAFTFSCFSFQVGDNAPSVQMTNNGPGVAPAGTKVHWVVKESNGDYVFPYPVQVHQITVLNGVARSGIGGCTVTVVP